ncbi:hypothetical protein [Pseudoroseomonas cervicalis]|uniref:hypothetical protein n=1 Tax=Teichococcus cervicalis TaxID=204525 RepID=UPI0022F1DA5A|nr:hypothetical protein [Pseudoroseomonas cervicalis]WBV43074.1 hypothetical protein PFY06_00450 [Pseudoroseomonas cervicalis]
MTDETRPALTVHELFEEKHRIEAEKQAAERAAAQRAAEELAERRAAFEARPFSGADRKAMLRHIHEAFDRGERELMLVAFPSSFCPDGGRRINHALEGWPEELPGYARRLYDFWHEALRPGGFGFNARIVNYPHGMPGDVGLFVTWPEAEM